MNFIEKKNVRFVPKRANQVSLFTTKKLLFQWVSFALFREKPMFR